MRPRVVKLAVAVLIACSVNAGALLASGPSEAPSSTARLLAAHGLSLVEMVPHILRMSSGERSIAHSMYDVAAAEELAGKVSAAYADLAVVRAPGEPPVDGRSAIAEWLPRGFENVGVVEAITTVRAEGVVRVGELATITGDYEVVIGDIDAPASQLRLETKFMAVLVRTADTWQILHQTWEQPRAHDSWLLTRGGT